MRRHHLLYLTLVLGLAACSSAGPQLKVIGVGQAQTRGPAEDGRMLVVYVEVVNKTARDLELSKLDYQLAADSWFTTSGSVRLSRDVSAQSTAVVEIPVPYKARGNAGQVAYKFAGKLYAQDSRVERSWSVKQNGTLDEGAIAVGTPRITTRIATQE